MGLLDTLNRILHDLGFRGDVAQFIALFGLAFARIVTAISMAPFLGGQSVQGRLKVGLAVIVVGLLYPAIAAPAAGHAVGPVLLLGLLVKEVLIGAIIGLLAQLVFFAIQTAGALIDTGRGMDQAAYISAQLPGNVSALGNFQLQAALVLFLALDGHLLFLRAIFNSYQQLPLATFPHLHAGIPALVDGFARVSAEMLVVAVQMSAPVLVALFLVDVCFGVIAKVAPQVNVYVESQPVKSLIGLMMIFLVVGFLFQRIEAHFGTMFRHLGEMLRALV